MPAASCLFGLLQLRGGVGALGAQTVSDLLQLRLLMELMAVGIAPRRVKAYSFPSSPM